MIANSNTVYPQAASWVLVPTPERGNQGRGLVGWFEADKLAACGYGMAACGKFADYYTASGTGNEMLTTDEHR
jgi:hypothetical protein